VYRLTWRLPLAGLVAFSHLQFSQIPGRQPYLIVRKILYVIKVINLMDALRRSVETERGAQTTSSIRQGARQRIRTSKEEKIALGRKSAFDQPQYRPPLYWWRLRWMFLGQHSEGLPEFIQQGGRIDACGSDALTSVAGGYQGGSFGVLRR
jgi:hypothetical protein